MQELQKITQYKMAAEIVLIYSIRQKEFIKDAAENILAFPHSALYRKSYRKYLENLPYTQYTENYIK